MTETYEIRNRWTREVMVTAEIDCAPDAPPSVRRGLAVRWAVRERKSLSEANLSGANLSRAYLSGAYLSGANLSRADLSGADLARADLTGADLSVADLTEADLTEANLSGANLSGAYLTGADLTGAKWRDGAVINRDPLQLHGLTYTVTILDAHMQIGCELHTLAEWAVFDDRRILEMDGKAALMFWRAHGPALLALAKSDGRWRGSLRDGDLTP